LLAHLAVSVINMMLAHKLLSAIFVISVVSGVWTWFSISGKDPDHAHISQPFQDWINSLVARASLSVLVGIRDGMEYLQHSIGCSQTDNSACIRITQSRGCGSDDGDVNAGVSEHAHADAVKGWTRSGKVRRPADQDGVHTLCTIDLTRSASISPRGGNKVLLT
jgi:hypothetical protein